MVNNVKKKKKNKQTKKNKHEISAKNILLKKQKTKK